MARPKALLVGNGVNLTAGLKDSWENIVREALHEPQGEALEPRLAVTPFPLLIESAFGAEPGRIDEREIQSRLARRFEAWRPGEIHKQVVAVAVPHILTTNWDLMLEGAAGRDVTAERPYQRESRYSLFRRNLLPSGQRVWHIHGSAQAPATMILGFEHYAAYLYVLRQVMVEERRWKRRAFGPVQDMIADEPSGGPRSWLEIALTHDLLIIGLRLDFAELGLWWLLTYRARMLRKSNRRFPRTRIVYACRREQDPTGRYRARQQQLLACAVEYREYDCDWAELYRRALSDFV